MLNDLASHADSATRHGARLEVQITPSDWAGRRPAREIRLGGLAIGDGWLLSRPEGSL